MLRTQTVSAAALVFVYLLDVSVAAPAHAERAVVTQLGDLLPEYDFIVAGGGTAGLTVADRLSESGEYTVLVVETGYLDSTPSIIQTGPGADIFGISGTYSPNTRFYNITSAPLAYVDGKPKEAFAGCVVGGSSAVNGMVFDRGSAEDYDAWVWVAGEKHQEEYGAEWGWKNLLPWFKKSVTFHPPDEQMVKEYGITYDIEAAYGGNTPIHSSYAPFQWPTQLKIWDALKTIPGIDFPKEGAGGDAVGVLWCPNSIEPVNRTRSYAKLGHWDGRPSSRSNFHLLPGHRVVRLAMGERLDSRPSGWVAQGVQIVPRDGPVPTGGAKQILAKREVIVSAGPIHTPQVLQRSGIGPREVLTAAGVRVRVELPGVGWNLQDHSHFGIGFRWNKQVLPSQNTLGSNATFAAEAGRLWQTSRSGPLAAYLNAIAFLPLSVVSSNVDDIVAKMLAQDPTAHLPQGLHPTLVAGFAQQLQTLAKQFKSKGSAVLEMPFIDGSSFAGIMLKPLSRGTVYLSPNDDGIVESGSGRIEPVLDWRTFSNPIDVQLTVESVKWIKAFMKSTAMVATFDPVETNPGVDVATDEAIAEWLKTVVNPSNGHFVGSAAMAPRELGGVVGPDLKVYDVENLSIADNSVITLIPGTHTSSTAYAIGEKTWFYDELGAQLLEKNF